MSGLHIRVFALRSILFLVAVAVGSAAQTTINVPADVATIQGAIDVANNGDTVLVAPGTYTENLDFKGKAITVVSASGAAATIIDGGQKAPVVQFVTNEPATAVLDGFTIRDGFESFGMGGGVKIRNSAPTVRNNVIRDNTGCNMSAVYLGGSSATIASNVISNNGDLGTGCSGGSGAGIYVGGSRSNGPNIIVGNQIVNNTAKNGEGGGVALNGAGNVVFQNNLVKGNSAYDTGGIWIINSVSELIVGNVIVDNVSALANNRQVSGVYLSVPYNSRGAYLLNNTISSGAQTGNAVYIAGYYSATPLTNNIIFGNNSDATVHCDPVYSSQPPLFSHNDLYSPLANAYEGTCGAVLGNNGNISAAPLFMDLAGGNYRLQPTSPAIDAGSNSAANLPDKDYDGKPRILDGDGDGVAVVDIGAYEYDPGPPSVTLSPSSLSFGSQLVSSSSAPQTARLTNNGTGTLTIIAATVSGPFTQTTTCGSSLAPGASCTFSLAFSPTERGSATGTLSLATDLSGTQPTVALFGTGIAPVASISATSLSFSGQLVNTTSNPQSFTLANTGDVSLDYGAMTVLGSFTETNNCGGSVLPGTSCTFNVTFSPNTAGDQSGSLTIPINAAGSPLIVTFSGTGTAPAASMSPNTMSFGNQLVGTSSAAQTATLTNTGTADMTITGAQLDGPFTQTTTCGSSLAPGASCTYSLAFTPTARRFAWGGLTIHLGNMIGSYLVPTVALSGTGVAPVISISPESLSFGQQLIGTTSAVKSFSVTNTGDAKLDFSGVSVTGAFQQTNTCTLVLAPGESCTFNVTYSPISETDQNGSVQITNSANNAGPTVVLLSGTPTAPNASISPTTMNFGNQVVGSSSAAQTATLTNTGTAVLNLLRTQLDGPFTQTTTCGSALAPGASCTFSLTFAPSIGGAMTGTLSVFTDVRSGMVSTVALSGTALAPAATLSTSNLSFGGQLVPITSAPQTVTLTNSGTAPLNISGATVSGPFAETTSCGNSLAVGASCTFSVTFTPAVMNAANGTLTITHNAASSPSTVTLFGVGLAPALQLTKSSLAFGEQLVGTASGSQWFMISNSGNATLTLNGISVSGPFAQTNDCTGTLPPGYACTVNVTFLPLTWGAAWGAVSVTVAGPASSQTLPLSGSGVDFGLAVNAIQVVRGGSANTAYTVAALGGTYSNPVSLTCGNLPKGATCSFAQNPATPGANGLTSTLTITTVKGTQTGTYWIVIVGASSTGQHSVNSALTVTK